MKRFKAQVAIDFVLVLVIGLSLVAVFGGLSYGNLSKMLGDYGKVKNGEVASAVVQDPAIQTGIAKLNTVNQSPTVKDVAKAIQSVTTSVQEDKIETTGALGVAWAQSDESAGTPADIKSFISENVSSAYDLKSILNGEKCSSTEFKTQSTQALSDIASALCSAITYGSAQ